MRRFINKAIWLTVHKVPWKPILIWGPWIVIFLTVAFYGVFNWKGKKAWAEAQTSTEALGVSLDLPNYSPREPLSSLNIRNLPAVTSGRLASCLHLKAMMPPGLTSERYNFGRRHLRHVAGTPYDISQWLPKGHPYKTQKEAAQTIDSILISRKKLAAEFVDLSDFYRYYEPFDDSDSAILSYQQNHQGNLYRNLRNLFEDDAIIAISLGDRKRALNDILFLLKLPQKFNFNPTWYNRSRIDASTAFLIWNFIKSIEPTANEISQLLDVIADDDPIDHFEENLLSNLAYRLAWIDSAEKNRLKILSGFRGASPSLTSDPGDFCKFQLFKLILNLLPEGHFRSLQANEINETLPVILLAQNKSTYDLTDLLELERTFYNDDDGWLSAQALFYYLMPFQNFDIHGTVTSCNFRSILILALETELYRISNGQYPENVAQLRREIPIDYTTGSPLEYRIRASGEIVIKTQENHWKSDKNSFSSLDVREIHWVMPFSISKRP